MQVTQDKSSNVWTNEEFLAGECGPLDIGQSKYNSPPLADQSAKPYAGKLAELGEAALDVVLSHPGGPHQWFKENPVAHTKLLVKLATPIQQGSDSIVNVNISWLSPERLSYKNGNVVDIAEPIEDAKVLEVLGTSWKPVEPEPTGINSLIKGIQDAK